jgi:hypothetical protein
MPLMGNVLNAPFSAALRGQTYFGNFFRSSAGVLLSPQPTDRRVRQMMQRQPLHEAGLGANAIHRGKRLEQDDLVLMGRLIIAKSVVKTDGKDEIPPVPDDIAAEVVDIALEEEIYPDVNPYLPVPILDRTAKVIEKFNPHNVIPLFSRS